MATLSLDDGMLWYETHGWDRDADRTETRPQPIVFVHGGWLNGSAWNPQIERFADEYRTVTVDVRGHGETGPTAADRYSIELFADDLEALLVHLEIEQPVLCGLSLGSMIVQEYLSRHPAEDATAGVILAGAIRSMPPISLPPGSKPFVSPMPALAATASVAGSRTTFRTLLQSIRATTGRRWLSVDSDVRSAAMDAVEDVGSVEFQKVFDALFRYDPPDLSGVETPTLVVHGEYEAPQVKRQGARIAEAIAAGRYRTIEDAGHLVNQDRPGAFNDVCAAFLADVSTE